ncbi:reverse transcriptase domain-containing protein [Chryseobacterium sp. JJR-5R]|uniref:reverse transcriptase domain-containing protein n=1 Tax=Chryseobacterium sp. JJR-5R TaxID=3093923 RepID=UPI002A764415|nr:reverse transcriptase domain-containing protein [Chryseobacterium sp. JJR-5R]WPO84110.1 reverse transcriptase domain-containing protein [Chryseobacterium sp. JJR-5R]
MRKFTVENIKNAYNKLRTTVFYDSGDLLLREQIVEFETNYLKNDFVFSEVQFVSRYSNTKDVDDINKPTFSEITLEDKFKILTEALNNYSKDQLFFDQLLEEISVTVYPKKFIQNNSLHYIITNKRIKKKYFLDKVTAFIHAPIELHIIAVLWTINDGVVKDAALADECIGNRLLLTKDKSKVVFGSALYKPYFSQYQYWRDNAVNTAQQLLKNNKNTLFLNLDIKDYYYSARISENYFRSDGKDNLNILMENLHRTFTEKVLQLKIPYDFTQEVTENGEIKKFIIPIGLQSSLIIANEYLKDFDKIILEKYKPAYYGRYVDDILIVLSEPNTADYESKLLDEYYTSFEDYKKQLSDKKISFKLEDLTEIELYILKNFHPLIKVVDSPFSVDGNFIKPENRIFKINGYPSLYCQSDKTMIHYFDKDESSVVIDKLKKEIEEKSSEFRDMPNDEDNLIEFEESAYHLSYDSTDGKIRTLKDYKEDRFGLSVYLSHKINLGLRKREKISDLEKDKILKFFKGENCLTFYKLWEKILTLFVVDNDPNSFTKFLFHCLEQIDNIDASDKSKESTLPTAIAMQVHDALTQYLFFAFEMSISLNLKFLKDYDVNKNFEFQSNKINRKNFALLFAEFSFVNPDKSSGRIGFRIRKSNMIRHHYVSIPLLNYTEEGKNGHLNLIDKNLHIKNYKLDPILLENSPRPIKFWECCIGSAFEEFQKFGAKTMTKSEINETNILYDILEEYEEEEVYENDTFKGNKSFKKIDYLDIAFNLYRIGNSKHRPSHELNQNLKNKFYTINKLDGSEENFLLNKFTVNKEDKLYNPKIAFANTDVLEDNIIASVLDSPILSHERINKLSKILSKARKSDAQILIFPENFMPMRLISALGRFSIDNQIMTVSGIEHLTINNTSFNFVVSMLPQKINGINDATVIFRLKNNYSPGEEHLINKYHFAIPKPIPSRYDIINYRNIYFSVCYCFELANISHREKLKAKIDLLIGVEWNKDTSYFSNIVEATSRDLHCFVAQVNTSKYGDTRLTQPKDTATKDLLKLKGGINDTILVGQIEIQKLRNFQRIKSSINTSKEFKPLPPEFSLEEVLKRINNI